MASIKSNALIVVIEIFISWSVYNVLKIDQRLTDQGYFLDKMKISFKGIQYKESKKVLQYRGFAHLRYCGEGDEGFIESKFNPKNSRFSASILTPAGKVEKLKGAFWPISNGLVIKYQDPLVNNEEASNTLTDIKLNGQNLITGFNLMNIEFRHENCR